MAVEALDGDAGPRPAADGRPRRRLRHVLVGTAAVLVLAVVAGLLAGGWHYSDQLLTYPEVDDLAVAAQVADVEAQGVDALAVTADGPLGAYPGVLVPGSGDAWVVVVHGRGGAPVVGAPLVSTLADDGRSVLFTSYRNDGLAPDDPDGYTTFGDREWRDLQAWVDVATAAGAESLVLYGFSMGGSIVSSFLRSAPDAELVDAVILDSPVLSLQETLELRADDVGVPGPLTPALLVATKAVTTVRAGMDFAALEHVARWDADVPALLIHGTADETVPDDPTLRLAAELGPQATLVTPDGVDHLGWLDADPAAYRARLDRFLDRVAAP